MIDCKPELVQQLLLWHSILKAPPPPPQYLRRVSLASLTDPIPDNQIVSVWGVAWFFIRTALEFGPPLFDFRSKMNLFIQFWMAPNLFLFPSFISNKAKMVDSKYHPVSRKKRQWLAVNYEVRHNTLCLQIFQNVQQSLIFTKHGTLENFWQFSVLSRNSLNFNSSTFPLIDICRIMKLQMTSKVENSTSTKHLSFLSSDSPDINFV